MSRKALGRGLSALFAQSMPLEHELVELSIDQLEPMEMQPRQVFSKSKLEELARSIKTNGIIQPIVVRRKGEKFEIVAGERRWRAAQMAGLHKVICIIKDVAEEKTLELSLIENLQREDLNPIEEANAYKKLLERLNLTQEEIANRLGKDRTSISNSLRLLKLPKEVQELVEVGKLSMGHARALLSIESADQQKQLAEEIIAKSLSVREVERLVKRARDKDHVAAYPTDVGSSDKANIAAAERKLSKKLGTPVKIKLLQQGGVIEIRFSSGEELSRLFDLIMKTEQV
jgi:ParB family chromosome partitioning protein